MHCPRNKEAISGQRLSADVARDNLLIRFEEPRRVPRSSRFVPMNPWLGEMESNFRRSFPADSGPGPGPKTGSNRVAGKWNRVKADNMEHLI